MRALGRRANNIFRVQDETGVDVLLTSPNSLLADLAAEVIRLPVDFIHFPLIYYFHADTEGASLPRSMIRLIDLCSRATEYGQPDTLRFSAAMLREAIADMAGVIATRFGGKAKHKESAETLRAMLHDHLKYEHPKRDMPKGVT